MEDLLDVRGRLLRFAIAVVLSGGIAVAILFGATFLPRSGTSAACTWASMFTGALGFALSMLALLPLLKRYVRFTPRRHRLPVARVVVHSQRR